MLSFPDRQRIRSICLGGLGLLLALPALSTPASAQNIQWTRQFGSAADDFARAVAVNTTGVYVAGYTFGSLPGQTSAGGVYDAYVRNYDASGNVLWTRQFGTTAIDTATGVAVDATGVYVAGSTVSVLLGQTSAGGGDAFIRKYDRNGSELWTRQFGTASTDFGIGVAADATGVYVVGDTFGTLAGQPSAGAWDVYVRKYDVNGNEQWTRQFGTADDDHGLQVTMDSSGVYIAGETFGALPGQVRAGGQDAFVRKYDTNGNVLWNREFGTAGDDYGVGVAVDSTGVYIVGEVPGALPGQTSAGLLDAFIRKYDGSGAEQWTREFGTASEDVAGGVAADATGVYVVGGTGGTLPGQTRTGGDDAFIRKYDGSGAEQWTRQFGSTSDDFGRGVAADATGVYVAGETGFTLPGQTSVGGDDAFVAKLSPPPPDVSVGGVVNNASFAASPAPVAPGSIAAVFGSNLNDGSLVQFSSYGADGKLVTTLGGASATINNIPAPMFYSFPGQLGVQVPFELAGQTTGTIVVSVGGQSSVPRAINLDAFAPGIFTVNQQGTGIAAALHQDGITPVAVQNPAHPNEVVVFFVTGLGAVTPALATGAKSVGNRTVTNPVVTIDAVPAAIDFSGAAPDFVGLNQINLHIPASTRTASNIPVLVTIGGKQSNSATIPVGP